MCIVTSKGSNIFFMFWKKIVGIYIYTYISNTTELFIGCDCPVEDGDVD